MGREGAAENDIPETGRAAADIGSDGVAGGDARRERLGAEQGSDAGLRLLEELLPIVLAIVAEVEREGS